MFGLYCTFFKSDTENKIESKAKKTAKQTVNYSYDFFSELGWRLGRYRVFHYLEYHSYVTSQFIYSFWMT